jgi:hypothetical protein
VPFKSKPGETYEEMKRSQMIETVFKFTPALHWKNQARTRKDLSAPRKTLAINAAFEVHKSRDTSTLREKFKRLSSARYVDKAEEEAVPRFGHRRSQSERTIKSAIPIPPKKERADNDVLPKDQIAIFTRELKNHNRFYVDYLVEPKEKFSSAKDLQLNIRPVSAYLSEQTRLAKNRGRLAMDRSPAASPRHSVTPNNFENEDSDIDASEKVKSFKNHIKKMERHNSKLEMQQAELNELYDNVSRKKSMSQDEKEFMKLVQKNNQVEVKHLIEHTPKVVRFTDLVREYDGFSF